MGGGGIIIIRSKLIKDALSTGLNTTGSVKLWHLVALTHVLALVAGALVF